MAYRISSDDCTGCGDCVPRCPVDAIRPGTPAPRIVRYLCIECVGFASVPQCAEACDAGAIREDEPPALAASLSRA